MGDRPGHRKGRAVSSFMNPWRRRREELVFGGGPFSVLKEISGTLPSGAVVLDVGCGPGFMSLPIARMANTGRVYCLDLSGEMLSALQKNADQAGLSDRIETIEAPADASGLEGASVDLVVSNNVVHELPDPPAAFAEWMRLLKPGGRVVFNDFRDTRLVRLFMSGRHDDVHGPYREEGEVESRLLEAGFTEVRVARRRHTLLAVGVKAPAPGV